MCKTQGIAQRSTRPRGRRSGVGIDHELLRRARREAGLSLAQVAGEELTRQAVHLIETGKVRPSRESLEVIAARVGRPAHEFLDHAGRAVDGPRLTEFEELCERHQYADLLRQAEDVLRKGAPPRHRAVAHFYAGRAHHQLNRHDEALEHLARAEELAGAVDNPWLAAEAIEWQAAA